MSRNCQVGHAKKVEGWDRAIADAKAKIKSLQFSIDIFEQNKREGRPWPEIRDVAGTDKKSVPA